MSRAMLSFKDRRRVQELQLRHGVIINVTSDGTFVASQWKNGCDVQVADADSIGELETILRASYVFPDDEE